MLERPLAIFAGLSSLAAAAACGARSDLAAAEGGHGGAPTTGASSTAVASSATASSSSSAASSSSSAASTSSTSSSSSASSSSGAPCTTDAQCDDGIACTADTCQPTGCVHTPNDMLCDDGMLCTVDTCVPGSGCQHTVSNAPCDDGIACTTDTCDPTTNTCSHVPCDGMCDDGVFCDGVERCDAMTGCVSGPPPCQLGLACSADACNEAAQTCAHMEPGGCAPALRLLVCDDMGNLLSVSPYGAPNVTLAPSNGTVWFDVAILNGRWFAIDGVGTLSELVPKTNKVKKSFSAPAANSLGAGPDGFLYAASTEVYRLDPDTGASTTLGALPSGYMSSGDIAFLGGQMFVSTDGPCGGALVQFDTASGTGTVIGGDGLGCVYGLGVSGSTMFVVNCDGKVGTFDPASGVVQVLSTTGVQVYGADVLP